MSSYLLFMSHKHICVYINIHIYTNNITFYLKVVCVKFINEAVFACIRKLHILFLFMVKRILKVLKVFYTSFSGLLT